MAQRQVDGFRYSSSSLIHPIMRSLVFIFLLCLVPGSPNLQAQSSNMLYAKVDSIMRHQLLYEPAELVAPDTIQRKYERPLITCHASLPANPEPLLIFNGFVIPKSALREFALRKADSITVHFPSDFTTALYGSRAANGLIVLQGKQRLNRKIKKVSWEYLTRAPGATNK
jgi:hypothetical protein